MALLTPAQFLQKVAEDQAAQQKAALDYGELIKQHDDLAGRIVADLQQAETDLDTLRGLETLAEDTGKESAQRIRALFTVNVGSIPTVRAHVTDAKNSIRSKG